MPKSFTQSSHHAFLPFFFPPVIVAVLAAIVAVDIWFFFFHGVAQPLRELAYNPVLMLMVLGLVVIATALHEIGHATATRYGGAEPGDMGVGIYIVWPAFYTDVTDAYRLGRGGRLRTDLGGVYFNGLFVLITAGLYAVTGFEPLLILIIVQHMQVIQQMLPFLRLDGYYILSDLVGVPDMFARIKPTLKSAVPGQEVEDGGCRAEAVGATRDARLGRVSAPRPPVHVRHADLQPAAHGRDRVGLVLRAARQDHERQRSRHRRRRSSRSSRSCCRSRGSRTPSPASARRSLRARGTGPRAPHSGARPCSPSPSLVAGVAGWVLLPNGDYRPIQPAERGTVQGAIDQFSAVSTGRPGLTEEREEELGGAPVVRDAPFENDQEEQPAQTATTSTTDTQTSHDDDLHDRDRPRSPSARRDRDRRDPDDDGLRDGHDGDDAREVAPHTRHRCSSSSPVRGTPRRAVASDDTAAVAVNTKDGSSVFRLAFSIKKVAGDVVDNANAAVAYSSCESCRTIALVDPDRARDRRPRDA